MKKVNFLFVVALFATALFTSCGKKCDKTDPTSDCYEQPCDPTDPKGDCYDPTNPLIYDVGVAINGIKWATRNVDMPSTFAAKPESAGMFYQWNRKVGWSSSNPIVNSNGGNVWNDSNPNGTVWTKANDPCPQGWRVPTIEELQTLLATDKVTSKWITQNDVNGYKFTDKTIGNTLFLPAVGFRGNSDGTLDGVGLHGFYWSSTHTYEYASYNLSFISDAVSTSNDHCNYGSSVRCVAE